MKRTYQVVTKPSTLSSRELAEFLSKDGQLLLPLVELLERGEKAIDEVIDVMGRATVEAVLRMFVVDGAKALRSAIDQVFGAGNEVQRCRNHKLRNVDWPDAAASVREGLDEIFTVNRLGLPASLRTCLTTTNIIDSTHSGIRQRTRRVTNWKNGEMALRWSAVAFVETEKHYRRVTGYEHLWMLKAHLDRDDDNVAEMQKVG